MPGAVAIAVLSGRSGQMLRREHLPQALGGQAHRQDVRTAPVAHQVRRLRPAGGYDGGDALGGASGAASGVRM